MQRKHAPNPGQQIAQLLNFPRPIMFPLIPVNFISPVLRHPGSDFFLLNLPFDASALVGSYTLAEDFELTLAVHQSQVNRYVYCSKTAPVLRVHVLGQLAKVEELPVDIDDVRVLYRVQERTLKVSGPRTHHY
jgi:hypothetical protein